MPRDMSGNYTLPAGNPVATGTTIASAWANTTLADIASQLNNVVTRDGLLGPTDPLKLPSGSAGAPSLTFATDAQLGIYRVSVGKLGITVGGVKVLEIDAAGLAGDVAGNITGNVTGDVTGNLTGNVTGNVTGDVTGNVSGATVVASSYLGVTADWQIDVSSGTLQFKHNGTVVATLTTAGVLTAKGDVVRNTSL